MSLSTPAGNPHTPPPNAPPPFVVPGRPRPTRPVALIVGGIAVAALALPFGYFGVTQLLRMPTDFSEAYAVESVVFGGAYVLMALASLLAAILIFVGTDAGRLLGGGLAGVTTWFFSALVLRVITDAVDNDKYDFALESIGDLRSIAEMIGGVAGITALVCLSRSSLSHFVADKRRNPSSPQHPPSGLNATPMVAEPPTHPGF
ncbi:MAG: hypothetical protein ACRD0P_14455 [Stackebrandtia sp.]